ncbi:MAG TPA: hypothetical protein VLA83_11810 [Candidatus Binatia bacterium]|nr:hypothetical protein [Candidatus Binatia bacterium]
MKSVFPMVIALAAAAGNMESQTASYAPKPAPGLYVTQEFGLVMKVPPGLGFCPLPRGWSGYEEGTVLFLKPPSVCMAPGKSSAMRPTDGFVPSISLRYHVNRGRDDAFDGNIPAPRTSEEFAQQFCAGAFASPDFKLFDQPAFTCRSEMPGNKVRIVLMALYDSARNRLILTLLTTPDRMADDTRLLATIASSITACQSSSGKEKHEEAACPKGKWW